MCCTIQIMSSKPKIILASASIGRKELLQKLGVPFDVKISTIDEEAITDSDPYTMLEKRARAKAEDIFNKLLFEQSENFSLRSKNKLFSSSPNSKSYLIIAADSMAIVGNETFGKSKDKAHAKKMVKQLMGKTHVFATATSIIHIADNTIINRWNDLSKTNVTMRSMTENEIDEYVTRYDFRRFAAAYTFNETPWDLITKIDGSYTNVIGLPFEVVLPIFRKLAIL